MFTIFINLLVTLFVPALPLAPVIAFVQNIFEERADAFKMLKYHQRPPPLVAENIGIWEPIIWGCSILAVTTNVKII